MLGRIVLGVYDAGVQAMLLAAGLGTRLKPLTDLKPKPIVPVANRPLAGFAMDHLARTGADAIVVNIHPQPEMVEATLRQACPKGVKLRFSREATLLGTGGGIRKARALFDDPEAPVIVVNGDTIFEPDLERAYAMHQARGAVATMILRRTADAARFGPIGIDGEGWVRSLLGSPIANGVSEELMFAGVHILAPRAFEALPEWGCIVRTAYRKWVDEGVPVLGVVDDSPWADLGTISDYHRLNLELASGFRRWPGLEPEGGCILAPGVAASSRIRESVIGADVEIGEGVCVERCVVWRGSVVTRSAANAVITPGHQIEVS